MLNKKRLSKLIDNGLNPSFLFFWKHTSKNNRLGPHVLSQWYDAPFVKDNIRYQTAEHYMMAEKARIFKDKSSLEKILSNPSPEYVKKIGRGVKSFNVKVWNRYKIDIVTQGSILKFSQNLELKNYLLSTKNKILVEASPYDPYWGIGMKSNDKYAKYPSRWKGENLLGFCLMHARKSLASYDAQ